MESWSLLCLLFRMKRNNGRKDRGRLKYPETFCFRAPCPFPLWLTSFSVASRAPTLAEFISDDLDMDFQASGAFDGTGS